MLTIFTIPKPFKGHIADIQKNAIKSWLKLRPECEIILYGDDAGVAEAAAEFGVRHIPDVSKTEFGTPLLDSVFDSAQQIAAHKVVCYVNADIILFNDLLEAVKNITFEKYLIVGQRWDVDIEHPWDFEKADWEKKLRQHIVDHGSLHPPLGSDYFVFPRWALGKLPPFAVGRTGWDTWVIYRARAIRIPAIDATQMVTIAHQNHDYRHVPGGTGKSWAGPEGDKNIDLMGGWDYVFTLRDTNHVLTSYGIERKKWTMERFSRFTETLPIFYPVARPVVSILRSTVHIAGSVYVSIKHRLVGIWIKKLSQCSPLKIIIGASGTVQSGWISTDIKHLNLLDRNNWAKYFSEGTIDAILAEHVWEHLTPEEAVIAATHCFMFIKPGGYLRVAVPDGLHPDPTYIEWVKPGGNGPGADDHKVLYTYATFGKVFSSVGFDVSFCEYFDEQGEFHSTDWDPADGMIQRSKQFDSRNVDGHLRFTSIILDVKKPLTKGGQKR